MIFVKKTLGLAGVSALLLTAGATMVATPAYAEVGDIVCNYTEGDVNVRVEQTGERIFKVQLADANLLGAKSTVVPLVDKWATLPTVSTDVPPKDLRMTTNVVTVDPRLILSSASLSQSIQSGPDLIGSAPWVVDTYDNLDAAPGESVSTTGNVLTWTQDHDAYTDAAGNQRSPGSYAPWDWVPDFSAGVLTFSVDVPNNVGGAVDLIQGVDYSLNSAKRTIGIDVWTYVENLTGSIGGCSIDIAALPDTVDPDPAKPTPPARVETGVAG